MKIKFSVKYVVMNTLLVGLSLLICLVVVEFGLSTLQQSGTLHFEAQYQPYKESNLKAKVHPYVGFTGVPESGLDTYFLTRHENLPKKEGEIVVGVFGGSVAQNCVTGLRTDQTLEAVLQAQSEKKVRVLNLSMGGYKQPQSLMSLAYALSMGQHFDVVLLIDGYNEATMPYFNAALGLPYQYPSSQVFAPMIALGSQNEVNKKYVDTYTELSRKQHLLNRVCEVYNETPFLVVKVIARAVRSHLTNSVVKMIQELATNVNKIKVHDSIFFIEDKQVDDLFRESAMLWKNSHDGMKALALADGAQFVHLIQANQYVSNHVFSDHEKSIAFSNVPMHKESVVQGYGEIMKQYEMMKPVDGTVESLLGMYDDVTQEVYSDSCCHYSALGEKMLQEYVAKKILQAVKPSP